MENKKKFYGLTNAYRKRKRIINVKDESWGVTTPEEITNKWTEYFEEFLNIQQEEEQEIYNEQR